MKENTENSAEVMATLKLLGLEQEMLQHQHRKARLMQKNAGECCDQADTDTAILIIEIK